MRKWLRIEKSDNGFYVITGLDETLAKTIHFLDFDSLVHFMKFHFDVVPPVEIFVGEKIGAGDKVI